MDKENQNLSRPIIISALPVAEKGPGEWFVVSVVWQLHIFVQDP